MSENENQDIVKRMPTVEEVQKRLAEITAEAKLLRNILRTAKRIEEIQGQKPAGA